MKQILILFTLVFFALIAVPSFAAESGWDNEARLCRDLQGEMALTACNRALTLMPSDTPPDLTAEIHKNKGVSLGQLGRHDEALYELKIATKLNSNDAKAWYNLGLAYEAQGHDYKALSAYRKAVDRDPQLIEARSALGYAAYRTERYAESKNAFEAALAIDPSHFDRNTDDRDVWAEASKVKPDSVAWKREVSLRLTPNVGYIFKIQDWMKDYMKQFVYILPQFQADVQIYKHVFGTVSFMYGHSLSKSIPTGVSLTGNLYAFDFGAKYASNDESNFKGDVFMDRVRWWISAGLGPYITTGQFSVSTGVTSETKTSLGVNAGTGLDYFIYPNVGIGLGMNIRYINTSPDNYMMFNIGPCVIGRF